MLPCTVSLIDTCVNDNLNLSKCMFFVGLVSETREMETSDKAGGILYTLVGTLSALTGGISFCLVKSGARATEQPMYDLFSIKLVP